MAFGDLGDRFINKIIVDQWMAELLEYAAHDSRRCRYYQECHCGLNDLTAKLGLPAVPLPEK